MKILTLFSRKITLLILNDKTLVTVRVFTRWCSLRRAVAPLSAALAPTPAACPTSRPPACAGPRVPASWRAWA